MIESVEFKNFKVLRDTTLPLSQVTLIVGPNGSGKTTAIDGLRAAAGKWTPGLDEVRTAGQHDDSALPSIHLRWSDEFGNAITTVQWNRVQRILSHHGQGAQRNLGVELQSRISLHLSGLRRYCLDAAQIAQPTVLQSHLEFTEQGGNLAGGLDELRDQDPERFESLNQELSRWIPEFDHVVFDMPQPGQKTLLLRTRTGGHRIPASQLSQGTLLALAMLTLAYLPNPPTIVCLEEPDRGIHPRLLRDVQEALYRLAHPESFGEKRPPVQVIATTHSPYMLDLFRDHPEEIVIASKHGMEARFERLSDRTDLDEILQDAHLGEAWYSGVLGGVPEKS